VNRLDWLQWRKSGVGASDCPIIMGDSPYSDILKLYDDKVSDEIIEKFSFAMELGNKLEPIARAKFELLVDNDFPASNFVHATTPHYRASLDGYNKDLNHAIEVKYVGATFTDKCPVKYYAQIQYQYAVSLCEKNTLVQINNLNEINIIEVERDNDYIIRLLEKVDWFWACVQKRDRASIEAYYETIKPVKKARKKKVKAEVTTEECLQ